MTTPDDRLAALGITLPAPPAPVADYVPFVVAGGFVTVSGQLPLQNGALAVTGTVGSDVDLDSARQAAQVCTINLLAQIRAAAGDLGRVQRFVRLGGFVNCTADFRDQPKVVNAASELIGQVFGEAGKHARTAVGVNALPMGAPVELDAVVQIAEPD